MKKTLIICFTLLILPSIIFGQKISYNVKLCYNLPYIADIKETPNLYPSISTTTGYTSYTTSYTLNENYSSKSGARISGNLIYQLNSRLTIEGGLQLNLIRYKQSTTINNNDLQLTGININTLAEEGNPYGVIYGENFERDTSGFIIFPSNESISLDDDLGKTNILYTEIPLLVGYSFFNNQLFCRIGISAAFLTYSEVYKYNLESYSFVTQVEKDKSSDGFTNFVLNGNVEIEYFFYKNIGLNLSYNRSFNSVYDENASIGKPKYNIFSLGISYQI